LRGLLAACVLCLIARAAPAATQVVESGLEIRMLGAAAPGAPQTTGADQITGGALDSSLEPFSTRKLRARGGPVWLRLQSVERFAPVGVPVVIIHAARQVHVELFAARDRAAAFLATTLPGFRGTQDSLFVVPEGLAAGQSVYAYIDVAGSDSAAVSFSTATLDEMLQRGAQHARMIALAFGALLAMALAALLIWFILADRLFVLYATLFFLQALYVVYLSGQGFDWPLLRYARPLTSFAWNVPISLSGAVACLFVREIADLRHFSPRVDAIFSWFAVAFLLVTLANFAKLAGYGAAVAAIGNVIFSTAAIFTVVVAFLAWRGGNRAAGWFLIAWGLLEGFTITAAVRFLFTASDDTDLLLYYYGLPLSMVAAAVLIALGVADRLRAQRAALTDAERRAQTDPLTGVLNRRSLIERLEAACARARARGLPIALLFIDLDHFKLINDSYGHQAGDACLRAIIEPIHLELRQSDVIGRYGGEEFVVILSSADSAAAHPIAQRILERVANVRVEGFGAPIRLTCSIGIAASDTLGVWGEHLIAQADAAVYAAKRSGRNQVHMAAPLAA
jgi:diguanylate cyclase (GGDEF)-like protein